MEIISKTTRQSCVFGDLNVGDIFCNGNYYYIKITESEDMLNNALALERIDNKILPYYDYSLRFFPYAEPVHKVKAQLIIS